ncbi:MAG: MgtC/SapB family protein [Patescibacteria group bacterium]|uniref:MgtC/SapB family protein n=1 Tax=candidate division WWE3 bacterium TaxID=2053526 RepID=A0A955EFP0_UNCKA|nr:MgtC/SapB family protein [candidate division WWE3 bacterium]
MQDLLNLITTYVFSEQELFFFMDLLLSILAGVIIGLEREYRGKDAGIATYAFVITGSMLFTYLSTRVDPASQSRIAAQIVTGIGFLGAGLILKQNESIRNLTTAASIWFAGAIGMAIGFQYRAIALICTIAFVLIPFISITHKRYEGKL